MIYGVGIDIEGRHRFQKFIQKNGQPDEFLISVFSERELQNYSRFQNYLCYGLSFSCKEAFFKAFGDDWGEECMWLDIELLFDEAPEKNKALVVFSGKARQLAQEKGIALPPEFEYEIDAENIIFKALLRCKKD